MDALPPQLLRTQRTSGATASQSATFDESNLSIKQRTRELEIELIRRALAKTNNNRTHAAKILELSHRALLYKLKEYELGDS
jgi:two-component system response regulator AtoC